MQSPARGMELNLLPIAQYRDESLHFQASLKLALTAVIIFQIHVTLRAERIGKEGVFSYESPFNDDEFAVRFIVSGSETNS